MKMNDKPRKKQMRGQEYRVKTPQKLEDFLLHIMQGKSRTALKQMLQNGSINVDGTQARRLDMELKQGAQVFVGQKAEPQFNMPKGLRIIWEDKWLIIVKKEAHLLTVGNNSDREHTAQAYLNAYMRFKGEGKNIFIVHRIDRGTSGILIFAKSELAQQKLRTNWNEAVLSRRYVAIVEGIMEQQTGTIDTWIEENQYTLAMEVCKEGKGKHAITHFKTIKHNNQFTMLELELETGRKNQIRIHLKHIGHPIVGDKKYGAQTDPCNRLCLHAQQIEFKHPMTGEIMEFTSELPREFTDIFKQKH